MNTPTIKRRSAPKRYEDADVQQLPKVIQEIIPTLKDNPGKGIFLYGGAGTGKTYALYALSMTHDIKVENWVEVLEEIKTRMAHGHAVGDLIDNITSEKKLAIDDVGAEKHTDYSQEKLYMIVNRMYNRMNRLFISTNLSLAEFQEKYGERLFSRIAEMCDIVELTGEDKRLQS